MQSVLAGQLTRHGLVAAVVVVWNGTDEVEEGAVRWVKARAATASGEISDFRFRLAFVSIRFHEFVY